MHRHNIRNSLRLLKHKAVTCEVVQTPSKTNIIASVGIMCSRSVTSSGNGDGIYVIILVTWSVSNL